MRADILPNNRGALLAKLTFEDGVTGVVSLRAADLDGLTSTQIFEEVMREVAGAFSYVRDRRARRPTVGARVVAPGVGLSMVSKIERGPGLRVWVSPHGVDVTNDDGRVEVDWSSCKYPDEVDTPWP